MNPLLHDGGGFMWAAGLAGCQLHDKTRPASAARFRRLPVDEKIDYLQSLWDPKEDTSGSDAG